MSSDKRTDSSVLWADPACMSCNCIAAGLVPGFEPGSLPHPGAFVGCGDTIVRSLSLISRQEEHMESRRTSATKRTTTSSSKGSTCTETVNANLRGHGRGHGQYISSVIFVGKMIFTASIDHTIRCWKLGLGDSDAAASQNTGILEHQQVAVNNVHRGAVHKMYWVKDTLTLFSGAHDRAICAWNLSSGKARAISIQPTAVFSVAVHGPRVFAGLQDGSVLAVEIESGQTIWSNKLHSQFVTQLCIVGVESEKAASATSESFGAMSLVSCSRDGNIHWWDMKGGAVLRSLINPTGAAIFAMCLVVGDPDNALLVGGGDDGSFHRLRPGANPPIQRSYHSHSNTVYGLSVSSHTGCLLSCGSDASVRFWRPSENFAGEFHCDPEAGNADTAAADAAAVAAAAARAAHVATTIATVAAAACAATGAASAAAAASTAAREADDDAKNIGEAMAIAAEAAKIKSATAAAAAAAAAAKAAATLALETSSRRPKFPTSTSTTAAGAAVTAVKTLRNSKERPATSSRRVGGGFAPVKPPASQQKSRRATAHRKK